MRRLAPSVALLAALLASGCFGGEGPPEGPPTTTTGPSDPPEPTGPFTAPPPFWFAGDWWKYSVAGEGAQYEITVVAAERGEQAVLAAAELEPAYESLFRHFPQLGPVSFPNLDTQMHGQTVTWFQFPLTDGKSWQADYRGASLTYTVAQEEFPVLGQTQAGFRVTASDGTRDWFRYTYTPALRWFSELEFYRGGSGTPDLTMSLTGAGNNWTGGYYDLDLLELAHGPRGPQVDPLTQSLSTDPPSESFLVADTYDTLLIGAFLGGDAGAYRFSVVSQADPKTEYAIAWQNTQPGTSGFHFDYTTTPATAGSWTANWVVGGQGFVFGEVFAVKTAPLTFGP